MGLGFAENNEFIKYGNITFEKRRYFWCETGGLTDSQRAGSAREGGVIAVTTERGDDVLLKLRPHLRICLIKL
jgi:hypothetical protein